MRNRVPFKALGDVRTSCCDTIMSHSEVDQNRRDPDVSTLAVGGHRHFREGKKKKIGLSAVLHISGTPSQPSVGGREAAFYIVLKVHSRVPIRTKHSLPLC